MQEKSSQTEPSKKKSFASSKKSTRRPDGASVSSTRSSKKNGVGQSYQHLNRWRRLILPHSKKRRDRNNSNSNSKCSRLMRLNNSNTTKICSSNINSSRICSSSKASYSAPAIWARTCRCLLRSSHPLIKIRPTLHNSNNNVHSHSNSSSHRAAQENRTGRFLRAFSTQCTPKQTSTYRSIPTRMSMLRRVRGTGILREEFGGASRVTGQTL